MSAVPSPPSGLDVIVHQYLPRTETSAALVEALMEREAAVADILRLAGMQFGLFPEIVAEVLAQVGLGRPIEAAQREHIRHNFQALMECLHEQHENGGSSE